VNKSGTELIVGGHLATGITRDRLALSLVDVALLGSGRRLGRVGGLDWSERRVAGPTAPPRSGPRGRIRVSPRPRLALLKAEKRLTRRGDELARRRRALPWVPIETEYVFDTSESAGWVGVSLGVIASERVQLRLRGFFPAGTAGRRRDAQLHPRSPPVRRSLARSRWCRCGTRIGRARDRARRRNPPRRRRRSALRPTTDRRVTRPAGRTSRHSGRRRARAPRRAAASRAAESGTSCARP
jgi:hypothetical protein